MNMQKQIQENIQKQIQAIIFYINQQLKNTHISYVQFNGAIGIKLFLDTNKRDFVVGYSDGEYNKNEKIRVDMYVDRIPKVYIELILLLDAIFPKFDFAFKKE